MAGDPPSKYPIYEVPYLRLFPWLRIFRIPAAAGDPKKLILAALGLLLTSAGWSALDAAFPDSVGITPLVFEPREPIGPDSLGAVAWWLTEPARLIIAPFFALFHPDDAPWSSLHAALAALWTLLVWGLLGGAIARVAVVGLTRGERVGILESLRFALRKALPLLGTPIIPLLGVIILAAPIAAFGLLYRLNNAGPAIAGVLGFFPLLGGALLTVVLLGLVLGWPLMLASVAAEAEDGFDAVSRAYAYVHQRPWHYLAYAALAFAVSILGLIFVDVFARLTLHLDAWALALGGSSPLVDPYFQPTDASSPGFPRQAHAFWVNLVKLLVRAWVYSQFWTASTVLYLLLRRDVDGTPWSDIAHTPRPNLLAEAASAIQRPAPASPPIPDPKPTPPDPDEITAV